MQGGPDGILFDPFNRRVWIFSHRAPNATVINAVDGTIAGTVDLGGAPEQAVTDGSGKLYVDLEDQDEIAEVDAAASRCCARSTSRVKAAGRAAWPLTRKITCSSPPATIRR